MLPNRLGCSFAFAVSSWVTTLGGGAGRATGRREERRLGGVLSFPGGRVKLIVCGRKLVNRCQQCVPGRQPRVFIVTCCRNVETKFGNGSKIDGNSDIGGRIRILYIQ